MPNFEKHLEASRFANSETSNMKNKETPPPSAESRKKPKVSEAKPQDSAETKNETHSASYLEAQRKMASETGKFYNSLLDTYLGAKTSKEQRDQINNLLESLPAPMRNLYGEGINRMQAELEKNHQLLEKHRGEEVRYLLNTMVSPQSREKFFQDIDLSKAEYLEPSPGIPIIKVDKDLHDDLIRHGTYDAGIHAIYLEGKHGEIGFIIIPDREIADEAEPLPLFAKQLPLNTSARHELHHFIWSALEDRGFLREGKEATAERTKEFEYFRDELVAYIISNNKFVKFVLPEGLVHSKDKETRAETLALVEEARDFCATCISIAERKGIDPQGFLYPAMTGRSFAELKDKFTTLTPLEKMDHDSMVDTYLTWFDSIDSARLQVMDLLERKKLTVPVNMLEEYALNLMLKTEAVASLPAEAQKSLDLCIHEIDMFIQQLGSKKRNDVMSNLHYFIDYTIPETVKNSLEGKPYKTMAECLQSIINIQDIDKWNQDRYKQVINSSPAIRAAFDQVRSNIIDEAGRFYMDKVRKASSERELEMLEAELKEKIRLFSEL